jgi:hypothetical protein
MTRNLGNESPGKKEEAEKKVGMTPREAARYLRVSSCTIHRWIRNGELGAQNVASWLLAKPQWVILPEHLEAFLKGPRAAKPAPEKARRRRKDTDAIDFYPD